ncbi:hypothetical protein OSTOST_08860 [Ostertagia ostertagi]
MQGSFLSTSATTTILSHLRQVELTWTHHDTDHTAIGFTGKSATGLGLRARKRANCINMDKYTFSTIQADDIVRTIDVGQTVRYFFIGGPGGSGKRRGRTASSTFKLNIHDKGKTSTMTRESPEERALRDISVIFWDEISMVPKWTMEAVDFLLRNLMQNEVPFGGKTMIVRGDFRQVIPVVEK